MWGLVRLLYKHLQVEENNWKSMQQAAQPWMAPPSLCIDFRIGYCARLLSFKFCFVFPPPPFIIDGLFNNNKKMIDSLSSW